MISRVDYRTWWRNQSWDEDFILINKMSVRAWQNYPAESEEDMNCIAEQLWAIREGLA